MGEILKEMRRTTSSAIPTQEPLAMRAIGPEQSHLFSICEENEAVTASAESKQPILYARNTHQCMVAVLYDEKTKRTGMLHVNVNAAVDAEEGLKQLANEVRGGNTYNKLKVYVFGCDDPAEPKDRAEAERTVVDFMKALSAVEYTQVECMNVLEDKKDSNLAFDTRNGDICYGSKLDKDLVETLSNTVRTPEYKDVRTMPDTELEQAVEENCKLADNARLIGRFPLMHDGFAAANQQLSSRFGGGRGGSFPAR